ncbi:MAG: chromosome partitioning protein [Blastocatellia bacterium]|jgi:chromosome partitioning protein|nr:chromosome partitioning protein [Blastocatellia bacterium]
MRIIAIANQKGGVGKTATAVSMAAALRSQHRKRVLLCDLDAQANASSWLANGQGVNGRSTYDVIMQTASLPDCIIQTESRIDLLPSNLRTANLDVELLGVIKFHERLSDALSDLSEGAYDYAILDCPPNLSMNTLNAFGAASVVVIPVEVKQEAFDAVSHLMTTLLKVTGGKTKIRPYGLPTFMNRTNLARDIYELMQERFQSLCLPPIHQNTRLAEAFAARKTIFEYDPTSSGALDYMRATKELVNDLEETTKVRRSRRETTAD